MIFPPIETYVRSSYSIQGRDEILTEMLEMASYGEDKCDYILKNLQEFSRQGWEENFIVFWEVCLSVLKENMWGWVRMDEEGES